MEEIEEYIDHIVASKNNEDMEELNDILVGSLCKLKTYDEECYNKYYMKIYELANGEKLTDELKREWVKEMKPMPKWSEEEVKSVLTSHGISNIPVTSAYVIMNMLYSDMKSALGSGEDTDSLNRYIEATKSWYFDEDAGVTGEEKLFRYYFKVIK